MDTQPATKRARIWSKITLRVGAQQLHISISAFATVAGAQDSENFAFG